MIGFIIAKLFKNIEYYVPSKFPATIFGNVHRNLLTALPGYGIFQPCAQGKFQKTIVAFIRKLLYKCVFRQCFKMVKETYIALGSRLKGVPEVVTLGTRPNFYDYDRDERSLIVASKIILYPTRTYAQLFTTMGKEIFPSLETYLYADEKIRQTTLFYLLGIPHPLTRFYYPRHHHRITADFRFPFIAKLPRASAGGRGVFLIENEAGLAAYLKTTKIAYIQEYLPHRRDIRVILINYQPVLAYWRECEPGSFKTNVSQGGTIDFRGVPGEAIDLARYWASKCCFNDAGLDLLFYEKKWYLIEANMKYGRKALAIKGMDLKEIIRKKLLAGNLFSREDA